MILSCITKWGYSFRNAETLAVMIQKSCCARDFLRVVFPQLNKLWAEKWVVNKYYSSQNNIGTDLPLALYHLTLSTTTIRF